MNGIFVVLLLLKHHILIYILRVSHKPLYLQNGQKYVNVTCKFSLLILEYKT